MNYLEEKAEQIILTQNVRVFKGDEILAEHQRLNSIYGQGLTTGFDEVDEFFKQRVRSCNYTGVGLETALRRNHRRKLCGHVHIGGFKSAALNLGSAGTTRYAV